jgi:cytochrome c oxidase subunit II
MGDSLRLTNGASQGPRPFRAWLVLFATVVAALVVAGCGGATAEQAIGDANPPGLYPGQVVTEQGRAAAGLYDIVFPIAAGVFILVEGLLIVIAIRFRRRRGDDALPTQTHGNNLLEIVWTVIPAVVVTGLFVATVLTLRTSQAKAAVEPGTDGQPGVTVDVQGFQWQWTFEYQAEDLSFTGAGRDGPQMVLPVGETARIRLHSNDVNHSFYVPQFFHKLDVIPGRVNEFDVLPTVAGTFAGQCAEFCGLSHAEMYFTVRTVPRAEYDAWVASEQEKARATAEPAPTGAHTIQVTSVGIVQGFDPKELTAPPDMPLSIELTNADATAPHDFAIRGGGPGGADWQGDPDAAAGESAVYQAPPLAAGTYDFYCSIHPNMVGTLQVGE